MGDHDGGHAFGPVKARERDGVSDEAGGSAQSAPEFVHDGEVLPAGVEAVLGEDGGGVDEGVSVRPYGQHVRR